MINFTKLLGGKPSVSEVLKSTTKTSKLSKQHSSQIPHPVVVFNLTQRCNLTCLHCYLVSANKKYKGELSFEKIKRLIDSLKIIDIPVLLLSGGEPLVHRDIFKIIEYAKGKNIRTALSTNGTLLTKSMAKKLLDLEIDYVGISVDGIKEFHDEFRQIKGAYAKAIEGLRNCLARGLKTGIRFTLSRLNAAQLPAVLDLCVKEKIPRFCLYHLVYSGRGKALNAQDLDNVTRRKIIDFLIERTLEFNKQKYGIEILTVDNHADGIYIYNYLKKKNPKQAQEVLELLKFHGGCSAANKIVNISPAGEIFACQFWQAKALGNIGKEEFAKIWLDQKNKFLNQLRVKPDFLKGKCSRCRFKFYCGGCRVRAYAVFNDFWQEDPCCYLTEEEISNY